jgi:hypothetical protein
MPPPSLRPESLNMSHRTDGPVPTHLDLDSPGHGTGHTDQTESRPQPAFGATLGQLGSMGRRAANRMYSLFERSQQAPRPASPTAPEAVRPGATASTENPPHEPDSQLPEAAHAHPTPAAHATSHTPANEGIDPHAAPTVPPAAHGDPTERYLEEMIDRMGASAATSSEEVKQHEQLLKDLEKELGELTPRLEGLHAEVKAATAEGLPHPGTPEHTELLNKMEQMRDLEDRRQNLWVAYAQSLKEHKDMSAKGADADPLTMQKKMMADQMKQQLDMYKLNKDMESFQSFITLMSKTHSACNELLQKAHQHSFDNAVKYAV